MGIKGESSLKRLHRMSGGLYTVDSESFRGNMFFSTPESDISLNSEPTEKVTQIAQWAMVVYDATIPR